jgi:hypothetical protein
VLRLCTLLFYSIFGMEVHGCYENEQIVADSASYSVIHMCKDFLAEDSRDDSYKQEQNTAHTKCIAVSLVPLYEYRSKCFCTWHWSGLQTAVLRHFYRVCFHRQRGLQHAHSCFYITRI